MTTHRNPQNLILHCINEMKSVGSSRGIIWEQGLDAKAIIVVDSDNINLHDTSYVESKPAPPMGDPVHYDAFIRKICELYDMRFP